MGTSWVALSIKNIKTRASREMILMEWTLPSTGMWRGEVFAISDCLVVIICNVGVCLSVCVSVYLCVRSPLSHYNFVKCGSIATKLDVEVAGYTCIIKKYHGNRSKSRSMTFDISDMKAVNVMTNFWRHGVFCTSRRSFWRHDVFYEFFDVMPCFDVIT